MFLGHYAVAAAAKKVAPKTSLGTLVLSAQFVDLLWPILVLAGVERVAIDPGNTALTPLDFQSYPITHSLLMALVWGVLFAVIYWLVRRYPRGALVVGALVVSHWVLDLIVHRPDLPLVPGGSMLVGLGLWNSIPLSLILEAGLFIAGFWIYSRVTRPTDGIGRWAYWSFIGTLALIYVGNVFGPPPPSATAIGWAGLLLWLWVPWGYWIDRHRTLRDQTARAREPEPEPVSDV
jgi:hypothetical protein